MVPRTHFKVSFLTGEVLQFFLLFKNEHLKGYLLLLVLYHTV